MAKVCNIEVIDCLAGLKALPDNSIQCCVTSPPFFQLRDYGVAGQIGLEKTPQLFIDRLVDIFCEVKRVLRKDGTCWVNMGDTYNAYKANTGDSSFAGYSGRPKYEKGLTDGSLKPKDMIGIPWMLAFALRQPHYKCNHCSYITHGARWGHFPNGRLICPVCELSHGYIISSSGWFLRQDIIWSKPNPMPESVTDRCTKSHEYIFLLSKSAKYYFDQDAIKEPIKDSSVRRLIQDIDLQKGSDRVPGKMNGNMKAVPGSRKPRPGIDINGGNQARGHIPMARDGKSFKGHSGYFTATGELIGSGMANKRSVWVVPSQPSKEAHFATYPEDLIVDCIKAGSRQGDFILDPFSGSGTTAVVASCLDRKFIGFELNPKYAAISKKRLKQRLGLFYNGP